MVNELNKFISHYTDLEISGRKFHCPYWSNKLKDGRVIFRGFGNGKGDWAKIKEKLENILKTSENRVRILSDSLLFQKYSKRNRIGIDCSGFVFRVLEHFVDLSSVFKEGINKTGAGTLTDKKFCTRITSVEMIQPLDLIRLNKGKHIALIAGMSKNHLNYVHSSNLTEVQGVHMGLIKVRQKHKDLLYQLWTEKTKKGENFGKKYLHHYHGDGIYRLKILD